MIAWVPASIEPKLVFGAAVLAAACLTAVALAEPAIRVLKGANQATVYASDFPKPLVVWVTDSATEQPLTGIQVHFTAGQGIGLSAPYAVTDEHGLASVTAAGLKACSSNVSAQIDGFPASKAIFDGLTVNKATLTVVPADLETHAGEKIPALAAYSIQGFVDGDTEATAQIAGAPVLTTTARENSRDANYAIKGGAGTLSAPNYTFVAGFGTLAVLDGPSSRSAQAAQQEAALETAPERETGAVRSALASQPAAASLSEPAFLAGLRGESGVFVRNALWQNPAAASLAPPSEVRKAIASKIATLTAPSLTVRAAVAAKSAVPTPAPASNAAVRAAVANALPAKPATRGTSASVRAAVASAPRPAPMAQVSSAAVRTAVDTSTPVAATPSSYAGSSIRKAFNPPGMP